MFRLFIYFIYSLIFDLILLILFAALWKVSVLLPVNPLEEFKAVKIIVGLILVIYLIVLSPYRSKIAGDIYCDCEDTSFIEAYKLSGAILRANLTFLPVIGFLFESRKVDELEEEE